MGKREARGSSMAVGSLAQAASVGGFGQKRLMPKRYLLRASGSTAHQGHELRVG